MKRFLGRILFILATLVSFSSLSTNARTNTKLAPNLDANSAATELPIDVLRGYLVVVEVTLAGLPHKKFLVDTGAAPSIVSREVAEELHLNLVPSQIEAANGYAAVGKTILPKLEVASLHSEEVPVLVADLHFLEEGLNTPISGILGMDILGQSSFRLDYRTKTISFGPLKGTGIPLRYRSDDQLLSVPMEVSGKKIRVLLDTGASGLVLLSPHMGEQLQVLELHHDVTNLNGHCSWKVVRPGIVALGAKQFRLEKAYATDSEPEARRGLEGLLGVGAMGFKALEIDLASQTAYLEP